MAEPKVLNVFQDDDDQHIATVHLGVEGVYHLLDFLPPGEEIYRSLQSILNDYLENSEKQTK